MPNVPRFKYGASTFNQNFDIVFRSVIDRLRRFDTETACGKWNTALSDDLRADGNFVSAAEQLFREAVQRHTDGVCIASDGFTIENVTVEFGIAMHIRFRLHFLDSPNGYGEAPARFSVLQTQGPNGTATATMNCGLREPEGNFWYPTNKRITASLPKDYRWAYHRTCTYARNALTSWIKTRP